MTHVAISESYQPLQEADILRLEQELRAELPRDYRSFLLAHNGGTPDPDVFIIGGDPEDEDVVSQFLGIQQGEYEDLFNLLGVFRGRIPDNLLPVARDPFGNLICLSITGENRGKVYFWDHEEEAMEGEVPDYRNVSWIADSFKSFLDSLRAGTDTLSDTTPH